MDWCKPTSSQARCATACLKHCVSTARSSWPSRERRSRLRERHRAWCLHLAEEGERDIWRADQLECVARLEREQDNVRAALGWTLTSDGDPDHGLRIAAAMVRFWDVHGDLREGVRWLSDLLALRTCGPRRLAGPRA